MVQQLFPSALARAFGSHPCRVVSVSYKQMLGCHGTFRKFEKRTGSQRNTRESKGSGFSKRGSLPPFLIGACATYGPLGESSREKAGGGGSSPWPPYLYYLQLDCKPELKL